MTTHLRQIEEGHLPQLRDWRNDGEFHYTLREYRLLNMINQYDWLAKVSRDPTVEMFSIQVVTIPAGVCGLCNINWVNSTAEVSILVCWGQRVSIAEEALELLKQKAFEEFNLHRLWAEIYEFDTQKVALFEGAGYVLEGRLREHTFKLGKYHDSLIFGLLRC